MTPAEALRAAAAWLDGRTVEVIHVDVESRSARGETWWVAKVQVGADDFRLMAQGIERKDVSDQGSVYTVFRSRVAHLVELMHIETHRQVPPTLPPEPVGFAQRFSAAFNTSRGPRGLNLVPLAHLRAAFPELDRATFERELYALRRADLYVLHTHDGRQGPAPAAWAEAAVDEDGRTFVYAARRES